MSFSDIIGHDREVALLKNAVKTNRAAHAYLFTGIDGIGKVATARAFAMALNCESSAESGGDSCGQCSSCRAFEDGSTLDFELVLPDEKGYIKIERVRELQRAARFRVERGYRVFVIDGAEAMGKAPSNAFLKTLEEPTSGTIIILVTPVPSALLPTILSRCQRINFRPVGTALIESKLSEDADLSDGDARLLATLANGSIARAVEISSGGIGFDRADFIGELLGLSPADPAAILAVAQSLAKDVDLFEKLDFLKTWLRDLILVIEDAGEMIVNCDMSKLLKERSGIGLRRAMSLYETACATESEIMPPRNANKRLAVEVLLLEFCKNIRMDRAA